MRVFAISDVHVDYAANARWLSELSSADYQQDVLILAGDVSDCTRLLAWTLETLVRRFRRVLYVPGNHDLWVRREQPHKSSFDKFRDVCALAAASGAPLGRFDCGDLHIVPLLSWYDYSFGSPPDSLRAGWMDFRACRWPDTQDAAAITDHFLGMNTVEASTGTTISFSHFLPRIDLMPRHIPEDKKVLFPVLGTARLDAQIRALRSKLHVYGHSHLNRRLRLDGITYVNNAFGYPQESAIAAKRLLCIHDASLTAGTELHAL